MILRFPHFLRQLEILMIWKRALIVAIPRPESHLLNQRVIARHALCVPCKIVERLISAHVESTIDSLLSQEQADILLGNYTVDQVSLLTQVIVGSFSATQKAGITFVVSTASKTL